MRLCRNSTLRSAKPCARPICQQAAPSVGRLALPGQAAAQMSHAVRASGAHREVGRPYGGSRKAHLFPQLIHGQPDPLHISPDRVVYGGPVATCAPLSVALARFLTALLVTLRGGSGRALGRACSRNWPQVSTGLSRKWSRASFSTASRNRASVLPCSCAGARAGQAARRRARARARPVTGSPRKPAASQALRAAALAGRQSALGARAACASPPPLWGRAPHSRWPPRPAPRAD